MSKTLGGYGIIRDGVNLDYCFKESIENLCEFCDDVAIVCFPTEDRTREILEGLKLIHENLSVYFFPDFAWNDHVGRTKLSHFQNVAAEFLNTDYVYLQQADEITHPDSYPFIRKAMEDGGESYIVERINIWGSPYWQLNVPQERKPCSTLVNRLAKKGYKSIDDGESISAPSTLEYTGNITMLHYGFVRDRRKMIDKSLYMQEEVFQVTSDVKLKGMELFDPRAWFSKEDLIPLQKSTPDIMKKWVEERAPQYENLY